MAADSLTVVVPVGTGPLGAAVAQAYRHLVACDLVEPCVWVTEPDAHTPTGVLVGDSDDTPRPLLDVVATTGAVRLRLVALVMPGDVPTGPADDDIAERVLRAIRDNQASVQDVTHYTLLVPTLDNPPGQPTEPSVHPGMLRGAPWTNVVVSPEDRADDGALAVPVGCGPQFPFHAAAALASLAATWVGMDDGPIDRWRREQPDAVASPGAERIVIMRSRSRSLTAPSTADTVPAAVLARRRAWPVPDRAVAARLAGDVAADLAGVFVDGPGRRLRYAPPPAPSLPTPRPITLAVLVRMIGRWLVRRLPELAAAEVRSRVISAADGIEDWVSGTVLGPNSAFRVDRRNRTAAEAEALAASTYLDRLGGVAGSELLRRTPPAEPDIWRALRAWSFALVDAGPLPDAATALLRDGGLRVVVNEPDVVAPPADDTSWWSPTGRVAGVLGAAATSLRPCDVWTARRIDERLYQLATAAGVAEQRRLSALPPPPDSAASGQFPQVSGDTGAIEVTAEECNDARRTLAAAIAERRGSFMWRVGDSLADAMDTAQAEFDRVVDLVGNPPGGDGDGDAGLRRSFWVMVAGLAVTTLVAVLTGATALGAAGVGSSVLWWMATAVVFVAGTLASVAFHLRRRFAADHERAVAITTYEHACDSVGPLLIEVSRLHQCYQQFLDWSEVVGTMVHRPFGPPLAFRGRNHGSWVGGLHAHRVGEGVAGADTMTALTNAQLAGVFTPSWLAEAYGTAQSSVTARYARLTASTEAAADPDRDTTSGLVIDPVAQRSPRRFVRDQMADGSPLHDLRVAVMDEVLGRLARDTPDRLADSVDGTDPLAWLLAAVPRDQAAPFTASLWTIDGRETATTDRIARRAVWVAAGLAGHTPDADTGVEVHRLAANTSALVSTVVCVDLSHLTTAGHLAVFGTELSVPVDRVPVPPPAGARSARQLVSFDSTGPSPESLPPVGWVISPTAAAQPPAVAGSYAFGSLVDGRPCRFSDTGPIPWHLRTGVGPLDGTEMVMTALQVLADASGLSFRFDGGFAELSEIEEHAGGIWVAFVDPDESQHFTGVAFGDGVLGHARVLYAGDTIVGSRALVGNDPDAVAGFGPGHTLGSVLLHELGHAMNLGHVDVTTEQMYPFASDDAPPWFGPGDLTGLWLLGVGRGTQ